jgi:hypothetical protein
MMEPEQALFLPLGLNQFRTDYYGRTAVHIPGDGHERRSAFGWGELNRVLDLKNHWTPELLKLVREGDSVSSAYYCDAFDSVVGRRIVADPAKTAVFLSMGATLIANEVQWVSPAVDELCRSLSEAFWARVAANAYCSFAEVQGFDTHFDLHDVFALQTEGEKLWQIYTSRAEAPIAYPAGSPEEVRAWFRESRGDLAQEVHMRPGDVLYLPRGTYHEARAVSSASLHLSFSIVPPSGQQLFQVISELMASNIEVRRYLREVDELGLGIAVRERIAAIGRAVTELAHDGDAVARILKALDPPRAVELPCALPKLAPVHLYRRTGEKPQFGRTSGMTSVAARAGVFQTSLPDPVIAWIFGRAGFALEELTAHFAKEDHDACGKLVDGLVRLGLLTPTSL